MRYCSKSESFEFSGRVYDVSHGSDDTRHGGPFDRGSADSYYQRRTEPHYYIGGTGQSERILDLNVHERNAYMAGYYYNEEFIKDFKEY